MQSIELEQQVAAPPERVWALLADHRGWSGWAGVREVVLRVQGHPAPNGIGAIRVIRARGVVVEEEIVGFDPPRCMEYRLTAGVPIRDHRGEVTLEPAAGGTRVRWRVSFRARIPGTGGLIRRILARSLADILSRLARYDYASA